MSPLPTSIIEEHGISTFTLPNGTQFRLDRYGKPVKTERKELTSKEIIETRGGLFADKPYEVDHVIPLALGGTNDPGNLQLLKDTKTISQTVWDFVTGKNRLPVEYKPENRQEGKMIVEQKAIDKYESGEITLFEAMAAVQVYDDEEMVASFLHEGPEKEKRNIFEIFADPLKPARDKAAEWISEKVKESRKKGILNEVVGFLGGKHYVDKQDGKAMIFEVGEGLDAHQKVIARSTVLEDRGRIDTPFLSETPKRQIMLTATAPVRWTAGSLARYAVDYGLEVTGSEARFTPQTELQEMLMGKEDFVRLSESEDLYGMAYRVVENKLEEKGISKTNAQTAALAFSFLLAAVVENPFFSFGKKAVKEGLETALKEGLEKELGTKLGDDALVLVSKEADRISKVKKPADRSRMVAEFVRDFKKRPITMTEPPTIRIPKPEKFDPELRPLVEEARKYKTADDFIESHGNFHGSKKTDLSKLLADPKSIQQQSENSLARLGFWTTNNKKAAKNFAEFEGKFEAGSLFFEKPKYKTGQGKLYQIMESPKKPLILESKNKEAIASLRTELKSIVPIDDESKKRLVDLTSKINSLKEADDPMEQLLALYYQSDQNLGKLRQSLIDQGYDAVILKETEFDAPRGISTIDQTVFLKPEELTIKSIDEMRSIYNQANQLADLKGIEIVSDTGKIKIDESIAPTKSEIKHIEQQAESAKVTKINKKTEAVDDSVYKANAVNAADKRRKIWEEVKDIGSDTKLFFDELLGTLSTRLKNIDPKLKTRMRKFEFESATKTSQRQKVVAPLFKKLKKADGIDQIDFDLAAKNGDIAKMEEIAKRHGFTDQLKEARKILNQLYDEAHKVGFDFGYRKNYFPRQVKKKKAFLRYMEGLSEWSDIQKAIQEKEAELGKYLTTDEKVSLINNFIRGFPSGKITLAKTGAMKERMIDVLDANLNEFYAPVQSSTMQYIQTVTEAVEARKFFGKGENLEDSIGAFINNLIAEGKLSIADEQELRKMLLARFMPKGPGPAVTLYRNLSYIDTMGSPISAITQIGDIGFALYKTGPTQTLKSVWGAVRGKTIIKREDIGIETVAKEFEDGRKTAKMVDQVFRLTGLIKIDAIGKNTLIDSTTKKFFKQARKKNVPKELTDKLDIMFGDDANKVLADMRSGTISEDVKLVAFNELLDVQPVALSEMPEKYLTGGNGRIFYMLKTYTLKLLDVYRNEVFQQIRNNPKKGLSNFVKLSAALIAMNWTADEIKAVVLNRPLSISYDEDGGWQTNKQVISDRAVDNVLRQVGFSKFAIYRARSEGLVSAGVRQILPPFKFLDSLYKDVVQSKKINELETISSIPFGGKLYYWWFGKGQEKSDKLRDSSLLEREAERIDEMSKEAAIEEWESFVELRPDLKDKLKSQIMDLKSGITASEKKIRSLGVANGERAARVVKELNKLDTKEERVALWKDWENKKILTPEVQEQVKKLLSK